MAHIEKRGKNTYRITVRPTKFDFIRKTVKAPEGLTGKALEAWLEQEAAAFELEVRTGRYVKPAEMTLEAFIPEWERHYAEAELSPTTLDAYRRYIKNYIIPAFGRRRLADIAPADLVHFLHSLDDENIHHNTKAYIWRVLKNILTRAAEWKYIPNNPAKDVKGPTHSLRKQIKRGTAWRQDQVIEFLHALSREDLKWQALAVLALFGGLRRGEILALEWRHVDFDAKTVSVEKSVVRSAQGVQIKDPKTQSSIRTISMPDFTMQIMQLYRKEWAKQKMQTLPYWPDQNSDLLFHDGLGRPMYPTSPNKWLREFLRRNNLPSIRLHDLRHISASLLIAAGVPIRVVSERLGHAKTTTTQEIYAHVIRESTPHFFIEKFMPPVHVAQGDYVDVRKITRKIDANLADSGDWALGERDDGPPPSQAGWHFLVGTIDRGIRFIEAALPIHSRKHL